MPTDLNATPLLSGRLLSFWECNARPRLVPEEAGATACFHLASQRGIGVRSGGGLLFRHGGLGLGLSLLGGCLFRKPKRFEPGGVHVNSPRLSRTLFCRLHACLCGLLLFLELRFGPGLSLF